MFRDTDELLAFLDEADVESVDFRFTDMDGRWRHLTVPAPACTPAVVERGVGFDGSSVGFTTLEAGDLVLKPDPTAAFLDPFHLVRTLGVICDVVCADTGAPYDRCPRTVAKRAEEYCKTSGVADTSRWGPEFEFYGFASVRTRNDTFTSTARVKPLSNGPCGVQARQASGYHAPPPRDQLFHARDRIAAELADAGVTVKYHHHEVGAFGQAEIELPMGGLLEQADNCQIVKYFTRMVAYEEGITVTFMPKPLFNQAGSGMHFHQNLFLDGRPLFYEEHGYAGLSQTALQYTAGILHHGCALTALTNPSTNSFKRLTPGFEAPMNLFFSLANRTAAIRVPKYAQEPEQKRMEYRPPDGTCNPYLAMASMLMAGLDGVLNGLDPAALGYGPYDEDIFQWTADRREKIQPLPRSLSQALTCLREDRAFLEKGEVFSPGLIDHHLARKWENECSEINRRPHPFEFDLYYDC